MEESIVQKFHESLERCQRRGGVISRFYEIFLMSSDDVVEKFRDTDMVTQERMLMASLHLMMLGHDDQIEGKVHYERLAKLHDREHLDIRPELYDLWLDGLIRSVSESDPEFSDDVENAWREMMAPGVRYMKAHY